MAAKRARGGSAGPRQTPYCRAPRQSSVALLGKLRPGSAPWRQEVADQIPHPHRWRLVDVRRVRRYGYRAPDALGGGGWVRRPLALLAGANRHGLGREVQPARWHPMAGEPDRPPSRWRSGSSRRIGSLRSVPSDKCYPAAMAILGSTRGGWATRPDPLDDR